MTEKSPLQQAVDIIGGQTATAKVCGVSAGLVWQWLNGRRPLPQEHCPTIEAATAAAGDCRRCEDLRPDIVWTRDTSGQITGYHVGINAPEPLRRSSAAGTGDAAEADGAQVHPLKNAA